MILENFYLFRKNNDGITDGMLRVTFSKTLIFNFHVEIDFVNNLQSTSFGK